MQAVLVNSANVSNMATLNSTKVVAPKRRRSGAFGSGKAAETKLGSAVRIQRLIIVV